MRVITGTARGRKLLTPEGLDTRPTSDMVKEAVFSIIQFEIEGAVFLDLFAGSGQMGIEALSRGARAVSFVDNSREAQNVILKNLEVTGFKPKAKVAMMESAAFVKATSDTFDIAFLDPPYNSGLIGQILPLLAEKMAPGGIIICESEKREELPDEAGSFKKHKEYRYGKIKLTSYRSGEAD